MPKCIDLEALICETFLDILDEKPFHTVKVTELVNRANISRSTFYLYFSSIYDVAEKMENDFIDGLIKEQKAVDLGLPSTKLELSSVVRAAMLATTKYLRENSRVYCTLSGPNGDPSFNLKMSRRTRRWMLNLSERYPSSLSRAELNLLAEYLSNGIFAFQRYYLTHLDEISDDEMAELSWRIIGNTLTVMRG